MLNSKLNNTTYTFISSYSDNNIKYSYDGDWGNLKYWDTIYGYNKDSNGYFGPYDFKDITDRRRFSSSQEFRTKINLENNVVVTSGLYYSRTKEIDTRNGWLFAGYATNINSIFKILNYAIYTQTSIPITNKLLISVSLRIDINDIDQYLDYDTGFYVNSIKDKNLVGCSMKYFYKINNFLFFNSI